MALGSYGLQDGRHRGVVIVLTGRVTMRGRLPLTRSREQRCAARNGPGHAVFQVGNHSERLAVGHVRGEGVQRRLVAFRLRLLRVRLN